MVWYGYLTQYLGGLFPGGGDDGIIMGTGEDEEEMSGESGPSVEELLSSS